MAIKLRLEIHRITLLKQVQDRKGKTYEQCSFSELLARFDADKQKAFPLLWTRFVEYFQNEFQLNKEGDKAITAKEDSKHSFSSTKNTISGEVSGGPTNREQIIFKRKNATKSTGKVDDDDVVSSDFFIKLWFPMERISGVLMIQSYSNSNISDLVRLHFTKFVQQYGFKLATTSYFPKAFLEEKNKNSNVVSVTYVKDKLSEDSRRLINPMFAEFDNLKVKIVVTGFRKSVDEFWQGFTQSGRTLNTDIDALEFKADEDNKVVTIYKDEEGHETTMNIDKQRLRDFAYYTLPESVLQKGKNTYDFEAIRKHTDELLDKIKDEIKNPKKK